MVHRNMLSSQLGHSVHLDHLPRFGLVPQLTVLTVGPSILVYIFLPLGQLHPTAELLQSEEDLSSTVWQRTQQTCKGRSGAIVSFHTQQQP